jgi:Response regulator containing CheY-like receiver, AAA-type ATPase, and DNA-binding domains
MNKHTKILIADDECSVADSLGEILKCEGYTAAVVYNGPDAVISARTFKPHLLLTDVMMPGMNGVEAALKIRRFLPQCKVLLCTAHPESHKLWKSAATRGFHFALIEKPAAPSELLARVARLTKR